MTQWSSCRCTNSKSKTANDASVVRELQREYRVIGHRKFILSLINDRPGIKISDMKREFSVRNRRLTWRRLIHHISVLHYLNHITLVANGNQQLLDLIVNYHIIDFARAKRPSPSKIAAIRKIKCFPKIKDDKITSH